MRAVSNTIGTVLLVAVVVALVALVTVFVFNISDDTTNNQPTPMNTELDNGPSDQSTVRLLDDSGPGYIAIRSPLGTVYNVTSGVGETQNILSVTGEGDASVIAGPNQDSASVIKQYEIENGISADIIVDKLKRGVKGEDWDYASIQAGVDNATAGDTIVVRRAEYDENVDVNKDVTIVAEPDTVIEDLNPERAVFDVTGDNASVRNFIVDADPRPSDGHYSENGFYVAGNDVVVKNNKIINATQIADSASVNVTGESARIVGNTFDKSNNGITSNDHSETHIVRRNNMLGLNNFDIKNLDSKGLSARSNYWEGSENVYGVVDTTRSLGAPVNPPVDGDATKGIGGNGRVVYNNGRMFILNGAGATDLYKLSITLEIGDGTVTIQPVSSNEFEVTGSTGNVDPDKVFNSTTLSQSDSVTESSGSDDGSTFNSGEALSFELNTSYNPPSSDGGTTSIDESLGSTTVKSTDGSSSSSGSDEELFTSETQTESSTNNGGSDDGSNDGDSGSTLDSINSVDTSPDWSVGLGETSRTIPVDTEIEFNAPVTGLSSDKISSVDWTFGDGTTKNGAGQSVKHTYDDTGSYSVLVTVTADDGKQVSSGMTVTVNDSLTAQDYEPIARIDVTSESVYVDRQTSFSGSNSVDYDGDITSYEWDFDNDGSIDRIGESASYTYTEIGKNEVSLTVTDNSGLSATRTLTVDTESSSSIPHSTAPDCGSVTYSDSDNDGLLDVTDDHKLQCIQSNGLSKNYELTQDIDASKTNQWNGGRGFDPIGSNDNEFRGVLDGNGYEVNGLFIDTRGGTYASAALLYDMGVDGVVRNVRLANIDFIGQYGAAGISSRMSDDTRIENIYLTGSIDSTESGEGAGGIAVYASPSSNYHDMVISDVHVDATITSRGPAGGIVSEFGGGRGNSIMQNAYFEGSVTGEEEVGGIAGYANYHTDTRGEGRSIIRKSVSSGKVYGGGTTGGAFGDTDSKIEDTYWIDTTSSDSANSLYQTSDFGSLSNVKTASSSGGDFTLSEARGDSAPDYMGGLNFGSAWETQDGDYPIPTIPDN